jgi:hypothetical protein
MNRENVIIVGISVFSTTVGVIAGSIITKRRLMKKLDEQLEQEIAETRVHLATIYKKDISPAEAVELLVPVEDRPKPETFIAAQAASRAYQGERVNVVTSSEDLIKPVEKEAPENFLETNTKDGAISRNIFVDSVPLTDEDFDMEEERLARRNGVPYIVTREEYDENKEQYEQISLTYFAHDDVLLDEDEKSIDNIEQFVGKHNLQRFGHGSGDAKIVYIRNELKEMDYEVLRSDGSYAEEVLGLTSDDSHLEHSSMSRRGRRYLEE